MVILILELPDDLLENILQRDKAEDDTDVLDQIDAGAFLLHPGEGGVDAVVRVDGRAADGSVLVQSAIPGVGDEILGEQITDGSPGAGIDHRPAREPLLRDLLENRLLVGCRRRASGPGPTAPSPKQRAASGWWRSSR